MAPQRSTNTATSSTEMAKAMLLCSVVLSVSDLASQETSIKLALFSGDKIGPLRACPTIAN